MFFDALCLSHIQPRAPHDSLSPVRFLARKAEWSTHRNLTSVLFSWSHQQAIMMGPIRLDTAVHSWFGRIIHRIPRVPRAMPVRASFGARTGIFNVFHIQRDPCGSHVGPAGGRTAPLRTRKRIDTTRIGKKLARTSYLAVRGPHGPLTVPARAFHGLFTIPKPERGP